MKKSSFFALYKYEIISAFNGGFTPVFAFIFPIVMGSIIATTVGGSAPADIQLQIRTNIIMIIALTIPMANMLMSFPLNFAQEYENGTLFRMKLFNISEKKVLAVKLATSFTWLTAGLLTYGIVMPLIFDILTPALSSLLIFIGCIYLFALILLVFSYSIASIIKKFGGTYAITMAVYFLMMILSGMMGSQPSNLPEPLKSIAYSLPPAYIYEDFGTYWTTGFSGYNFAPLVQSFVLIGAIAGIFYIIQLYVNRSKIK